MTGTGGGEHAVPDALSRARRLLQPVLREATARISSTLDPLIAYQLGWQGRDGQGQPSEPGKALRPAIALLSAEAVGGVAEDALLGAVAVELVHNFSLVHDDIMDRGAERRHRPSLWTTFGSGPAIAAGDALAALAYDVLLSDPAFGREVGLEFSHATIEMILGQASDLSFEVRNDVSEAECLGMMGRKTGALFSCAAAVGGMLGGGDDRQIGALRGYGRLIGVAHQAVDDLAGIWGDPARTGKPAVLDLRQKKKSLPVVHALASGGDASRQLEALLGQDVLDDEAIARARSLLDCSRCREWTLRLAAEHIERAIEQLTQADLTPSARADLREIGLFVLGRGSS